MPIYVWKCEKCELKIEELRKMGDDSLPENEHCESDDGPCEFKKQVTSANFRIDPAAG